MTEEDFQFQCTASLATLRRRSQLLREICAFFEDLDFIHVETPLISRDTVVDRYIEPIRVARSAVVGDATGSEDLFLQTSPEFAMKRLLASGAKAIYQICKAFRKGEAGRRHNPEFTMLEWYRVGDDLEAGIQLLADFASRVIGVESVERLSYREAFLKYASLDPFVDSVEEMRNVCVANKIDVSAFVDDIERDSWLNLIMSEIVEPNLGVKGCVIVDKWPSSQSALAQVVAPENGDAYAERFELFFQGVELANGYHELLDPDELTLRNQEVNRQRESDGNESLPESSYLVDAMKKGLPSCSGVALGVDRLLMVLLGHESIDEVIAFPFDRA